MKEVFSKRVTMFELFYDLVFVYMLSQATGIIHHLHHGVVSLTSFLTFIIVMVVFLNSWMVQTVYTNRFGNSSWRDITFTFIDMMIVLYLSNSFTNVQNYRVFFVVAGLLSFTLFLQYIIVLVRSSSTDDRKIASVFAKILGFQTLCLLIGGGISGIVGDLIALIGVVGSWWAPSLTGKYTRRHPIIFSHLLERLTLLTIVTFGETIVGISEYFSKDSFTGWSVLVFGIVAGMFYSYITEFDQLIEEHQRGETGNRLIYLHYPILFGISLVTVALTFIHENEANPYFVISCLYGGLLLFYFGIMISRIYNRTNVAKDSLINYLKLGMMIIGGLVSLIYPIFEKTVIITIMVIVINIIISQMTIRQQSKN